MDSERFSTLIKSIYSIVAELESMFDGRRFTPDGHMVGSIGEALASYHYGIKLHPLSHKIHDGQVNGKQVQIKVTQGNRIVLSSLPKHLLVLRVHKDGSFTEVYNGPGEPVWEVVCFKVRPKNGQYQIGLAKLRELQERVRDGEKIDRL